MNELPEQNEFPEIQDSTVNTTDTDVRNTRVLFLNQLAYTLGMGAASILAWGFMVWVLWNPFIAPALGGYPIHLVNAVGIAFFLMAAKRMGKTRPQWARRPLWFECNDEVRRGLIIDDIQNGIVRPLLYAGIGAGLAYFSGIQSLGY